MVKKNNGFKFKGSAKKVEKKPRKKSSFIPYDESIFFTREDNTDDLVRTFLRDTRGFRSAPNYYEEDNSSLW